MPKKPKREKDEKGGTWSEDQKEREYYYDDAHGYEKYEPESDDESGNERDAESTEIKRAGASSPSQPANVNGSAL